MPAPKLGRLRTLTAREVWASESQVFTPWLSENLSLLGDTLGLVDLELEATEVAIGDFRLDILAKDTTGDPVIIENQFGATDHGHLGQLITYAAGQSERCTVIWIAERFREDHRAAIDWLNASTTEALNFFAVEIEALAIGDSDPAPYFNVVAKPNAWTKSATAARKGAGPDDAVRHRIRVEYWKSFAQHLVESRSSFSIRREVRDHWFEFPLGRSGAVISATINMRPQRAGVELYLSRDAAKLAIHALAEEKETIEREIGSSLEWQQLPNKRASRIRLVRTDLNPSDAQAYPELHIWMLDQMERFRRTFISRVRALQFTDTASASGEAD